MKAKGDSKQRWFVYLREGITKQWHGCLVSRAGERELDNPELVGCPSDKVKLEVTYSRKYLTTIGAIHRGSISPNFYLAHAWPGKNHS